MFYSFNYCMQPLTTLTIIFTLCRILIQDPITFAQEGHMRKNAKPVANNTYGISIIGEVSERASLN